MNENIAVQVTDGVASSISTKLKKIADDARKAYSEIQKLQRGVDSLAVSQAKLATSNQKVNTSAAATARAQAAQAKAATQLATAQNQAAASAARTAAAQSNAAAAASRAETAALRLANAQRASIKPANDGAKANQNAAAAAAALDERMKRGGMTAKAYNNAMRGVPAQITDIVVSLQGGQAPFTVFLQQGGQLKDMFGGIKPAAKALATSFIGMINPITLAIGAFVALGVAMFKFEQQARQVNSILAQFQATGRGDLGKGFVGNLKNELNELPGITRSAATAIINEFASVRNIGGPIIEQASKMVADFAAATGQDAPKAAKALAESLQDPLKGAIELDKQLGFLTVSQFKQINALSKAGQTAKAQKVVLDALGKTIKGLADESMTPLQRETNKLSNAWDKFMGSLSDSKFLQDTVSLLAKLVEYLAAGVDFLDKFGKGWQQLSNMGPGSLVSAMRGTTADATLGSRIASGPITDASGKPVNIASSARTGKQFQQTTKFKTDAAGITGGGSKEAESRAKALARINAELDNEIRLQGMLGPLREAQERMDSIQERLLGRGIDLRKKENAELRNGLRAKVDEIIATRELEQARNAVFEEGVGVHNRYQASLKAIDQLQKEGVITSKEATRQQTIAFENYSNMNAPLRELNIQLDVQAKSLTMVADAAEIYNQVEAVRATALSKGLELSAEELKYWRERYQAIQDATRAQSAYQTIYDETIGKEKDLNAALTATNKAYKDGILSIEQYQIKTNTLAVEMANLRIQQGTGGFSEVALSSMGKVVEGYQGMLGGLTQSFGGFFTSISDGFSNSLGQAIVQGEDLGTALQNVAKQAVGSLISSLVKLGIQYAINASIGSGIAAAATTANAALAAATASAWAPAAAAVSLASYGANAIPAEAGMAAVYASSRLMASLPGFMDGGWTGNMGRNQVAGVVHGQEMVMDAPTTARNRELLDAISSGRLTQDAVFSQRSSMGGNGGTTMNVSVDNQAPGVQFEVQQLTESDVRIIARREANKQSDSATARNLRNSNSKTFREMNRSTTTKRQF